MSTVHDGPASPHFKPLPFVGNAGADAATTAGLSDQMAAALDAAPSGNCVCWGIPFEISAPVILTDRPVSVEIAPTAAALAHLSAHVGPSPPESPARAGSSRRCTARAGWRNMPLTT